MSYVVHLVGEIHDLMLSFFQTLFEWTNALGVFHFISFSDLIDRCTFHAS